MPRKRCRGRQAGGGGAARRARKFPGPPRNLFSANRREPSRAIATVANRRELSQPSRTFISAHIWEQSARVLEVAAGRGISWDIIFGFRILFCPGGGIIS